MVFYLVMQSLRCSPLGLRQLQICYFGYLVTLLNLRPIIAPNHKLNPVRVEPGVLNYCVVSW